MSCLHLTSGVSFFHCNIESTLLFLLRFINSWRVVSEIHGYHGTTVDVTALHQDVFSAATMEIKRPLFHQFKTEMSCVLVSSPQNETAMDAL